MNVLKFIIIVVNPSSEWKESKEYMDALLAILEAPKFEDGKYYELVRSLGKVGLFYFRSFCGIYNVQQLLTL